MSDSVPTTYAKVRNRLSEHMNLEWRLPAVPFEPTGSVAFFVLDFTLALSSKIQAIVERLADECGDRLIDFLALDPPDMWHRSIASTGDNDASSEASLARDLFDAIELRNPDYITTFNVLTDVFAISGDSNTWAVWGERDCELAILMIPARLRSWVESTGLVLDPDDDFIGDLTLIGYPRFLPDEFADELRANMHKLAAHGE